MTYADEAAQRPENRLLKNAVSDSALVTNRDGRISAPAIRIQPDFHYPAKSASGRIARFMPDQIGANYY